MQLMRKIKPFLSEMRLASGNGFFTFATCRISSRIPDSGFLENSLNFDALFNRSALTVELLTWIPPASAVGCPRVLFGSKLTSAMELADLYWRIGPFQEAFLGFFKHLFYTS